MNGSLICMYVHRKNLLPPFLQIYCKDINFSCTYSYREICTHLMYMIYYLQVYILVNSMNILQCSLDVATCLRQEGWGPYRQRGRYC